MSLPFDSFTLAASTADLGEEPAARGTADCVEFRMDLAEDPAGQLAAYDGELPILATNRAAWEGGEAEGSDRLPELEAALEHDAVAAVDVEIEAVDDGDAPTDTEAAAELVETARERGVSVVVSAHDFEGTPDPETLRATLRRAAAAGDVGKLAVTATDRSDALAVLSATHELTEAGASVATMAMGVAGSHTRAVAPVYGSKIGYAPVDPEKATAPGQYALGRLRELVEALGATSR
jgi:3-dehydroquinate dehydratase-1